MGTEHLSDQVLESIYRQHADGLYRYALALTGDRGLAEEAVQETMVAAWRSYGTFEGRARLAVWLTAICRHKVLDLLRRRRDAGRRMDGGSGAGSDAWEDSGRMHAAGPSLAATGGGTEFWDAFGSLEYGQREALLLVFHYGFSQEEAALVLGIPKDTLRSRVYRGRKALKRLLDGEAPGTKRRASGTDDRATGIERRDHGAEGGTPPRGPRT